MKKIFTALFCASLLAACSSTIEDDPAIENDSEYPEGLRFKNAKPSSPSGGNLIDHGGKILPTSNIYAIWWGNQSAWPSDTKDGMTALFQGFSGSSMFNLHAQYMRGNGNPTSAFQSNWTDTSTPPNHAPSVSLIVGETCKVINQNAVAPDPTGIYFVYTSNFPRANYCAWHSYGSCNGVTIQVAYMPNTTGVAGCDPGNSYGCNTYSQGTRSLANVTSHEFYEAVTDPTLKAWYDNTGSEGADKCAWKFSSCVNLTNGSWQLQQAWSNTVSGCVQQ